jgi:hypothetical protein
MDANAYRIGGYAITLDHNTTTNRAAISNANANVNPYTNANGNAATNGNTGANHPGAAGSDGHPAAGNGAHLLHQPNWQR